MGNNKIILILFLALVPFITKAQDNDWPRFELYQLVQGQDSGIFVITDSDSNLVFTDLLKMRFFPDTALIFNGDTIAIKPDIPSFVEGLGISIEYDPVLNQYTFESLSIEDSIHNGTASLITKGTPLYAAGVQGNYWDVAPADAGDPAKMPVVIIAGEDIAAGENGLGLIKGHIKQVNTTGLASGAEVYVAVGGGYTATKPKGENAIVQRLGTVIKGNSTNGSGIINLGDPQATSNLNPDKIFIGGSDSTVTTINLKTLISDSLLNYATKVQLSDTALAIRNSIPLVISDSLLNYATKVELSDTALAIRNSIPLVISDSLLNYATKVELSDTALAIRNSIPLVIYDSLLNYATKVQLSDTALAIRNSIPLVISDSLLNYATKDTLNFYYTKVQVNDTLSVYVLKTALTDSINNRFPITLGTQTNGNYIATGATSGAGISGSATGEGSTFTVTSNATTLNTPNTIVYRDASGNFKAGVIEGNLAGIAREVQSALTPGYGITPSDTYNGSITRTYRIDTSLLATLAALRDTATSVRSAITAGVTGTFINGAVPYSASGGSTLTNSGWSIDGGKLLRGYSVASYDLDVNGSIGGTTLTTTGRINADSILVTKGAIFNTQQGSFNFRVDGNLETGLIFANATTNRVGIGLTGNPNYKLDVNGDVNISSGSSYRINGTPITGSQWTTTGSDIYYNSGRVGIGMIAPTSTLHVTGDIRGTDDLNIDNGTFFVDASENAVGVATSSPQFPLDVVGSARIDGSTFFVSSSNDRVGLGTGTPNATLDVRGDAVFNESGGNFDFRVEGDTDPNLFFIDASADGIGIGTNVINYKLDVNGDVRTSGDFDIWTSAVSPSFKVLNSNGNVGIRTFNPSYELEVIGDVKVDSLFYNGLQQLSDKTIKTNIKPIKNQLENITKLNPVSFEFNDKIESRKGQKGIGLIAQELEEVYPNLVSTSREHFKSVSYIDLIPYLISAIQEQQTQIEELKQEVKQLKKKQKQN